MPTTSTGCGPTLVSTVVVSPSTSSPFLALPRSMTTSWSPLGARPSASVNGLRPSSVNQVAPITGAPMFGLPIVLPSLPTSWA